MQALLFFSAVLLPLSQAAVTVPSTTAAVLETTTPKPTTVRVPLTPEVVAHVVEVKSEPTMMPKSSVMPHQDNAAVKPMPVPQVVTVTAAVPPMVVSMHKDKASSTPPASPMPTTEDPCDLVCTKMELNPVCASNERCVHEFPNECVMLTHNCRHAAMPFKIFKHEPCDELLDRKSKATGTASVTQPKHQEHQHLHPSLQQRCTPEDLNGAIVVAKTLGM